MANPYGVPEISVQTVEEKRKAGESFIWLDVREAQEYAQVFIDDDRVVNVPLSELAARQLAALPAAVQDNCAGCHMPARNKIQVHFETEIDSKVAPVKACEHRIGIYPSATQEVLYNWYRQQPGDDDRRKAAELASTLSQHWFEEAERCRRGHRWRSLRSAAGCHQQCSEQRDVGEEMACG